MSEQTSVPAEQTSRRVFVHIGAPKTGTTFVQQVMWANKETLAADGVLYPYAERGEHLQGTLDIRDMGWGDWPREHFDGKWDEIATRIREWTGHTVICGHEVLGGATASQITRLVKSLEPAEVHVIFTARDLARQMVSDWQEHLKHRHTIKLEQFVKDLVELGHDAPPPFGDMFWGLHDGPHILKRWATVVPPERVHIVTVPQPGAPSDTLWQRFCAVTALDPAKYDTDVERTNPGLGIVEAELIRRVNQRLAKGKPRIPARDYDPLVRLQLSGKLGGRSDRIVLPSYWMPWVLDKSREMVDDLKQGGYDVSGDLEELIPRQQDHKNYTSTDEVTADQLMPSAVLAITTLLRIASKQRARNRELRVELGELPESDAPEGSAGAGAARLKAQGRTAINRLQRRVKQSRPSAR